MGKVISVIIPCFNATKWLPKCFLSLVGQTIGIEALELIFVNDASTDDGATWEMLLEFEKAYPESIMIIDLPQNRRQGGARNEALKYASGEYLAFVDADDWVEEDLYEKAYKRAKDTDADIVQFNHKLYFDGVGMNNNPKIMADEIITVRNDEERKRFLISEKITYGCWNKLYKRSLVAEAGVQYAEHVIYEEPLFVYPLLFHGTKFVTMWDYLYVYRQNNFGTMRKVMKDNTTLKQHAMVQLAVWEFMKNTPFFERFYEEIKLYFLHTYFYETLLFGKQRGLSDEGLSELYAELAKVAVKEVPGITRSPYEAIIPEQMKLYKKAHDEYSGK